MFGNCLAYLYEVLPRRAFAELRVHASAHFFKRGFFGGGFVTAIYTRRNIRVERGSGIGNGKMPRNGFTRFQRFSDYIVRMFVGTDNPGEVHHFAETDAFFPLHSFGNIGRMNFRPGIFKSRYGGHA